MIKKLDKYIISTFLGPFIFIFSILFFIFSVQFAFQEISKVVGKGLTFFEISKLLFYLGTTVIQMVVPLAILLASIMSFGGFGERYELAAMKSTGISLARIMLPLFLFTLLIATGLFFFSNNVLPDNHKKAKNLLYNIANSKPTLRFVSGQFNSNIPGYTMRVDKIEGENGEFLENVMIHKKANAYQNQTTIISKKGTLTSSKDKQYLKFELYDGFIYDQPIENLDYNKRLRQSNTTTQFDTLTKLMDVSILINKALDNESIGDHFRFYKFNQLKKVIDSSEQVQDSVFKTRADINYRINTGLTEKFDSIKIDSKQKKYSEPFNFNKLDSIQKANVLKTAISQVENYINQDLKNQIEITKHEKKQRARMIIHQQRIIAYSAMCIIFFLIGAPLGSIIRKGGLGMPVIVSIFIFIIWFIIFTYTESIAKLGELNPYLAAWFPNLVMFPLGIFLTKKAMDDSELFDIDKYIQLFKRINILFGKKTSNNEHKRYQ